MGKSSKQEVRERVWKLLGAEGVARFPGAKKRIPNFEGAGRAAERLAELEVWKEARTLKCNPDSPQRSVRKRVLEDRLGPILFQLPPRWRVNREWWSWGKRPRSSLSDSTCDVIPSGVPRSHSVRARDGVGGIGGGGSRQCVVQ